MHINIEKIAALNAALAAYEKKNGTITATSDEASNWNCRAHGNCTGTCCLACDNTCAGSYGGR